MRRWRDSAWRMCRRTWCSPISPRVASIGCSKTGLRRFRDTTSTTRAGASPRRHLPCWSMRFATGAPERLDFCTAPDGRRPARLARPRRRALCGERGGRAAIEEASGEELDRLLERRFPPGAGEDRASGSRDAEIDHCVLQTALRMDEDAIGVAHRPRSAPGRARFGGYEG